MTHRKPNDTALVPIHPPGACSLGGQAIQEPVRFYTLSYFPPIGKTMFALVNVSPLKISLP